MNSPTIIKKIFKTEVAFYCSLECVFKSFHSGVALAF